MAHAQNRRPNVEDLATASDHHGADATIGPSQRLVGESGYLQPARVLRSAIAGDAPRERLIRSLSRGAGFAALAAAYAGTALLLLR